MKQQEHLHLTWRAGFGPGPDFEAQGSRKRNVEALFADSANGQDIAVITREMVMAFIQARVDAKQRGEKLKPEQQQREQRKDHRQALNMAWLQRMASSPAQLREKMTFFWHDHFATRLPNVYLMQQQNNTLRQHALGSYRKLLFAVAKDPAMLQFLNNQQNRKQHPNENFARELLELFTLGHGHYTEADIKDAARAFTGWGFDVTGAFAFRERQHDSGSKTFLGKTGNLKGEDILNIVLEQRQTATFITQKVYAYFVDEQVDAERVQALAKDFYESDYDIAALLRQLFLADWFYDPTHVGTRIKSPIELLAGLMRTFNVRFADEGPPLFMQKLMGQILFAPPNVSGWPSGRSWIDTSTMMIRLKLPEVLLRAAELNVASKDDGDEDDMRMMRGPRGALIAKRLRQMQAQADLAPFIQHYARYTEPDALVDALMRTLLLCPPRPEAEALVRTQARNDSSTDRLLNTTIALLTLPEYQLA